MANRKELRFETLESGCIIPVSHVLNKDGYFRKRVWYEGELKLMMYHRYVWLVALREIPEGYEIDHLCRNRACCNIKHLQCIHGSAHATKTNIENSVVDEYEAYWLKYKCTGTHLAKVFGLSASIACRHIRKFKRSHT